ncbi:MAG: hypothetical protein O7A64_02980 [Alphaproteobacteria bacterium]|jgi:hypothetical protein|nr:hypothetical protein [Alphaproteobacteria bacterium]
MVMRNTLVLTAVAALVGACGYVSAYEEAVYDVEPVYCYQSIGQSVSGVECYKTPKHRDERRLVNYYGPHPSRYDRPEPPPPPTLAAPPAVDFFVRDPEPIPQPAPPRVRSKPEPAEDLKAEPAAGDTSEGQAAPAAKAAETAPATPVLEDTLP